MADSPTKTTPLVTTLIPTFNRQHTIVQCIQSVLDQTYQPIEIIVVDDGSLDDTGAILEREFGNSIVVMSQENQGQSAATRWGLEKAKGELIAFLDSDDLWTPNKIQSQVAFLSQHPQITVVYTDAEEYSKFGENHKSYVALHSRLRDPANLMHAMVNLNIPLRSTVLCRRPFLVEHNIAPDPEAQGKDDVQVFMEIIGHGGKFGFIDEVMTYRRMHDTNMSSDHYKKFFKRIATFENMLLRCQHLPRRWQSQVKKALSNAYFRVGESHWGELQAKQARYYFCQALFIRKSNVAATRGLLATWIPKPAIRAMRSIKRKLRSPSLVSARYTR